MKSDNTSSNHDVHRLQVNDCVISPFYSMGGRVVEWAGFKCIEVITSQGVKEYIHIRNMDEWTKITEKEFFLHRLKYS
jgi:hypothetical protein